MAAGLAFEREQKDEGLVTKVVGSGRMKYYVQGPPHRGTKMNNGKAMVELISPQ